MSAVIERRIDVRWRDNDALGHVNNAVYLTYLEEARDSFYRQFVGDLAYVAVRIEIDFRAEIRHADREVTVRVETERVGTTSLTTRETILTAAGQTAAEARVITVRWEESERKAVPFGADERARLLGG